MTDSSGFTPKWPPNWINASDRGNRSYSAPDSVLIDEDGILRCTVSDSASKFVSVFGPLFIVFFVFVCWMGIDDFRQRVAFMTLGVFCGLATFGLIFAIVKHHESRGDYIVVDRANRIVRLPRHKREFPFKDIQCLQLLTGPDKNDQVINHADLNLLVNDAEEIVRFHLIGNPNKDHTKTIGQTMETRLFNQQIPPGWYRSSDSKVK